MLNLFHEMLPKCRCKIKKINSDKKSISSVLLEPRVNTAYTFAHFADPRILILSISGYLSVGHY